jgi:hypothetical protein
VRKTAIPFVVLAICISLVQSPAFGADQANIDQSAKIDKSANSDKFAEIDKFAETDKFARIDKFAAAGGQRALTVAQRPSGTTVVAPVARAHKIENVPLNNTRGDNKLRGESRGQAAATDSARSDTKLALLDTARLRNPSASPANPQEEQWLRISESPQPGSWAILLAGFLGICAVARPRIFSS